MKIVEILRFLESEGLPFTFRGEENAEVERFSSLSRYKAGSFTWVKKQENIPAGFDCTQVALAFVSEGVSGDFPNVIETGQSKRAFFSTMEHFYSESEARPAIGQFTYLSPQVKLGKNVRIGHNCTLDGDITIGDDTVIWNGVTIVNRVEIGRRCEIQSGCVIGHDGFGYTEDETHAKTMVRHFGGVTIGDDVHMGMNNVVARGVIDDTVIGDGVKMSDLCHIGHNNSVGENSTLINSALFGSCHIGENAYISYSVVKNQTTVGENAFIGMASNVLHDVPKATVVVGNPARVLRRREKDT